MAREVVDRLPATVALGAAGFAVASVLGTAAAVLAARRPGGPLDHAIRAASLAAVATPAFLSGSLAIALLAPRGAYAITGPASLGRLWLPVGALATAVGWLQSVELSELEPDALLGLMRDLEVIRRKLDAGTDRLVDRCDSTAAHCTDGHKSTKPAVKHLGRLSGREAHGRVQTARQLRRLPAVAAAYAAGVIPTELVRAICRVAANPRVEPFLEVADPIFAEMATESSHDRFTDWIQQWEALADADGAAAGAETGHERRNAHLWRNDIDATWDLQSHHGDAQGVAMADILAVFEQAELEADLAAARAEYGDDVSLDQLPRTPAQRRADALFAIFRRAAAQPAGAQNPEPLVNIVIDCETQHRRLQVDHRWAWHRGGPTTTDNSDIHCGVHNRLKETGFTPTQNPDGTWTIHRPDGTPITGAA